MANYDNMHDDAKLDIVLSHLYNNLPLQKNLYRNILKPAGIILSPREISRIAKILVSTEFIEITGGYGDDVRVQLTSKGIQIMRKYGSYFSYLAHKNQVSPNLKESLISVQKSNKRRFLELLALWATIISAIATIIVIFL
jgi:predicted transcriptional regulator